jgi:GAF domain-containing protein
LRSIDELLQPIFHHSDAGVSVADREKKYLIDYHALYADAIPATPEAQAMNLIAQEQGMVRMPLAGSLIEWAMGQPPMLGKLADLLESGLDAPYLSYEIEHGLTHYLCAPLKVSGNTFGFFNLLFREVYQPDVSRLPLFAQITDVIAVALANILANEEILEREREKTRLLEITELIAQVKADDDLLKLIVEKVKPLFGFEECGLFVVSADGKTHSDWAAIKPAISLSEWSLQSRWNSKVASVSENTPHLGSLIDWAMQEIEKARSPVLFDFKDMVARFPDYPQFVGIDVLGLGFRDSLAANLTVRGKAIGMFCINALQKDFFQPAVFPLFQSVTHTISIAVANILANEEILKREREKSQLLSISNALVMVQSRGQLFRVIYDQIRPLFPFDIAGLLIVDEQEDTHYEFTDDYMLNSADEQRIEAQVGRGPFSYRGSFVEYVINQETPLLLDLKAFEKEFSHPQIPLMLSLGYRQAVAGSLCNGGKNFGMLCFSSKKQDFYAAADLPLFTAIAEQLAVVVANILAKEEILKREREKSQLLEKIKEEEEIKSVLLSINNNLINIQDRTQLLLRLAEELSKLILIDSLGLKTIHENKQFSERLFFTRKPDNSFVVSSQYYWPR